MSGLLKSLIVGVSCALLLSIGGTLARGDAPAASGAGTIVVTVNASSGPATGVSVKLYLLPATAATANAADPTKKHKGKGTLVDSGTTDAMGTYTFSKLADGNYSITAGSKDAGTGKATATVSGGASTSVSVTLKAHKPKV